MCAKCLIVIVGPTAVGKTRLAIRLAEHLMTDIISADSRQVYSQLEIGTAKPDTEELNRVRHHFINTKSLEEPYDAGTFGQEARDAIDWLFTNHDHLILCGGSGLYIRAVLEGFDDFPEISPQVRLEIIEEYSHKGITWLQEEVASKDAEYYEIVDKKNPQRLMRALEIIRHTGKSYSGFRKKENQVLPFKVVKIGLEMERAELYKRIDDRIDSMIQKELFAEAEMFFTMRHANALRTVGYQEVYGFLEGKYDRDEAIRLMKRNSRRYAKRQLTWFKKDKEIQWFHPDEDMHKFLSLVTS